MNAQAILTKLSAFNKMDTRPLAPIRPGLVAADLASLGSTVRAVRGYRLGSHPALTTWLVIDPTGHCHLSDAGGQAFATTADCYRFIRRAGVK
jgi:hypothetical protein